jgi:hypothetical protein
MLLERADLPAAAAIEHLVGLQGQAPDAPYVALWSRLRRFAPGELADLLVRRAAVRLPLMRATIHLVSARDARTLRPLLAPVHDGAWAGSPFAKLLADAAVDVDEVLAVGLELVEREPLTRAQISAALAPRWPEADAASLAYAVTFRLPLVQVPPRGVWGQRLQATWTTLETWLGELLEPPPPPDATVLRYLAAFGPASVQDAAVWCGLTGMRELFERLRPQLVVFAHESGRELFDLPGAPRPDPDTPAPPRFLPEYDNVLLSHADRTHLMPASRKVPLLPGNGGRAGTLLEDGFFRATWKIDDAGLTVTPLEPLGDAEAVAAEGERLLRFAGVEGAVRVLES